MKKIGILALLLAGTLWKTQAQTFITTPAPYCASEVNNGYNMVSSVNVQGTNFATGPAGVLQGPNADLFYRYYNTTTFPVLTSGANATISIGFYGPDDAEPMYYGVWIDFNHNNTFETSELVMQNNNTNNAALPIFGQQPITLTKTFAVPAGAAAGVTRMRVRRGQTTQPNLYNYDNTFSLSPCPAYNQFDQTYGCTYDFNVTIGGGAPVTAPDAAFTANPTTAIVNNTTVAFTDQSQNTPTSWQWTITPNTFAFQNGTSATSQNPSVKFTAIGNYTVKLKVSNTGGADSTTSVNYITVQNPGPVAPVANFAANNLTPVAGLSTVTFTDQSTNAPTSRLWNISPNTYSFQNGTSATSANPQVVFNAVGDYTVTLTSTNSAGSNTTTKANYIHTIAPQIAPAANFKADVTVANVNTTVVSFTDLSTNTPDTRHWWFTPNTIVYQNNGNSLSANPKVIFTAPGDYTVKLRVSNTAGSDSITKTAYIHVNGISTGFSQHNINNIVRVFPNPSSEYLYFDFQQPSKIRKAAIISIEGKMISDNAALQNNSIDIRSLSKGTYILKLEFDNDKTGSIPFTKL